MGKSTIFNRLIKKRKAIESEVAGTTRDRVHERIVIQGMEVELIDTGGIQFAGEKADSLRSSLEADIRTQAQVAIVQADIVVFVVNAMDELIANDFTVADILRQAHKPTILVANKCDNVQIAHAAYNVCELGFGEPIAVSAVHSRGFEELSSRIIQLLRAEGFKETGIGKAKAPQALSLAIVGRPNVGKSSFFNSLIGEKRSIVSDIAGTTRDELDTLVEHGGHSYLFKDTAGIRKKGKVDFGIESLSVMRSLRALEDSNIALLLIDYKEGVTRQDLHVAQAAVDAGKGIILVVNKSDLMPKGDDSRKTFLDYLQRKCGFLSFVPVIFTSALTGKNVDKVFELADTIHSARQKRIPTSELNDFVSQLVTSYKPHGTKSIPPKVYYVTQVETAPPHFIFFVNNPDAFHFSYKRYMENQMREHFGFGGTVMRMEFRARERRERNERK